MFFTNAPQESTEFILVTYVNFAGGKVSQALNKPRDNLTTEYSNVFLYNILH